MGVMRRRVGRGGRIIYDRISIPNSDNAQPDSPEYHEVNYFEKISFKIMDEACELPTASRASHLDSEAASANISMDDIEIICRLDS